MYSIQDGAIILEGVPEFQKLADCAAIERRPNPWKRQQGLEFRREHNAAARWTPVVERLDAHRIPKQKQSALCRAPNSKCEHATDMPHALCAPGCECLKKNLRVGLGAKAKAFRFEFMSQFAKIVDLAIEGQYVAIASVHHRLMAARAEINDAEPIVTDSKTS